MKNLKNTLARLVILTVLLTGITSCGSAIDIKKSENDVARYTLKNKSELMQQKILNTKSKTVVATP
tara:strand:+ start:75957 stop:76154 length:198 start_codon:yes stop_codon:yes gene_type:complete